MQNTCTRCTTVFTIIQDDLTFYQKMKVPPPQVCPDCRFMMRAMWRNEMSLYNRSCDMCEKSIISMYNPHSLYTVYCNECYRSDKWDPKDYKIDYDQSKPFFEQLNALLIKVPKQNLGISTGDGQNVNTEYANMVSGCKNCYLVFNSSPAEELLYSRGIRNGNFSSDTYFGIDFENCYECINVQKSSGVFFSKNIVSCVDSYFLLNCSNLINCFGCVNVRNKSYCWYNKQLTKEEYESKLKDIVGSYQSIEKEKINFDKFTHNFPMRESNNFKCTDSTGEYLSESKNCKHAFEASKAEDCSYIAFSKNIKDSLGTIGYGTNATQLLECVATGYSSNIIGSYWSENCQDLMYTFNLRNSQNCIGCDSMKNAKYCILNKEYEKNEYEKLKNHIVDELTKLGVYGLMIPPELSPFGYNETIGNDNMPLTKDEAEKRGFKWQDEIQKTTGKGTLDTKDIPDNISDVGDGILDEILTCVGCTRNYRITNQEFFFYKRMKLPIPRKCFFCRHHDRIEKRGPYKFWKRNCALCNKDIETNFAPNRPEIVYCEECYRREVL